VLRPFFLLRAGIPRRAGTSAALLALALLPRPSDPRADLGLELSEPTPVVAPLAPERVARIAARIERPASFLEGLERHRARGAGPSGPEQDLLLATLPLPAPLEGARLVCALQADGRLAHAVLRGRPEFDGPQGLGWELFLGQMCTYGSLGPAEELVQHLERGATPSELASWRKDLAEGPDGALVQALIAQRTTMHALTLFQRRLILGKEPPDTARLAALDARLAELGRNADALEPVLGGEGTPAYRRELEGLRQRLSALPSVEASELPRQARRLCGSCHSHPSPAGGDWTDAASTLRTELGFPPGVLRIGYDLAPAPGDEGARSQLVADAVRAVLLASCP